MDIQKRLQEFRFSHHRDCKVIHIGDCFPAKQDAIPTLSRQEAFHHPETSNSPRIPSPRTPSIPEEDIPETHDEEVDPQHHRNQEKRHNGPRKHLPSPPRERGELDRYVTSSGRPPMVPDSPQHFRHPHCDTSHAGECTTTQLDAFYCWSQRDDYDSYGLQQCMEVEENSVHHEGTPTRIHGRGGYQ